MIYVNQSKSDGLFMSYDPFAHCVKYLKIYLEKTMFYLARPCKDKYILQE